MLTHVFFFSLMTAPEVPFPHTTVEGQHNIFHTPECTSTCRFFRGGDQRVFSRKECPPVSLGTTTVPFQTPLNPAYNFGTAAH